MNHAEKYDSTDTSYAELIDSIQELDDSEEWLQWFQDSGELAKMLRN